MHYPFLKGSENGWDNKHPSRLYFGYPEPSEIVEVINPRRIQGVKNKEIVRGSIPSTKILGIWKRIFARRMVRDLLEIH